MRSGRVPRFVAFGPRRWIAFASFLALVLGFGLFGVRIAIMIPYLGSAFFILGLFIWYLPGLLFAWTGFFRFHEFGASPTGVEGYVVMVLFYAALAVIVSWPLAPRRKKREPQTGH